MSRLNVRQEVRTALQTWAAARNPAVAFHDTINWHVRPRDARWCTVEFYPTFEEPMCYERRSLLEYGTFDVSVFTRAGAGDAEAVALADALEDYLMTLDLSAKGIELLSSVPASEATGGDSFGNYYAVTISVDYTNHISR